MHSFEESLATWSTILGTVLSFFGLIQSRAWLAVFGALFAGASIIAVVYAKKERLVVESAMVRVGDRSIDSLNMANLRRRVNRSLVVQSADHVARIEGEDLAIEWKYSGYCRAERETAIEFSVDADNNTPFSDLKCFGHDLQHDPNRKHRIRPFLISADGISKKIALPFLEPIRAQQPFSVALNCELPGCMKAGLEYYISTLSFEQDLVSCCTVRLTFVGARPNWVRVYDYTTSREPKLLKDLRPARQDAEFCEYVDIANDVEGQSARMYLFSRAPLSIVEA